MMLTITQGASSMKARPMFSCIREKPGPDVAVMAFAPAREAPHRAAMEASSSSIWMNSPPTSGIRRLILWGTSDEGVMW